MKNVLFLLFLLPMIVSCNDDKPINQDEITIERQEDYNREIPEEQSVPVQRDEEVDIE